MLLESQAIEAEKQEKAAAEEREKSKKKVFGLVKPVSTLDKLRSTLVNMKKVRWLGLHAFSLFCC